MALKIWVSTPFFYPDMSRPWSEVLDDMLSIVDAAEDLGFEGVAINENHFQNYVTNPSAITFATLAAARTERIQILPGIVPLPNYHPLLLASQMSLHDHVANGRAGIGVARGGARFQFDRIGVAPQDVRGIYEESLEIIRRAWVEDDMSFDGKYFAFPRTTLVPKPITKPHPGLWVAAQSVEGVTRVAEQGLNLVTAANYGNFEPFGDLDKIIAVYDEAVKKTGNPRGEVMVYRHTWLGHTEEEATRYFDNVVSEYNHYLAAVGGAKKTQDERLTTRGVGEDTMIVRAGCVEPATETPSRDNLFEKYSDPVLTTPDRMIERFKSLEQMGVDHVTCLMATGMPGREVVKNMELMAKEVLPAFADN